MNQALRLYIGVGRGGGGGRGKLWGQGGWVVGICWLFSRWDGVVAVEGDHLYQVWFSIVVNINEISLL